MIVHVGGVDLPAVPLVAAGNSAVFGVVAFDQLPPYRVTRSMRRERRSRRCPPTLDRSPRPEQVPSIAGDVHEDRDASVWLVPRLAGELNSSCSHPFVQLVERTEVSDA